MGQVAGAREGGGWRSRLAVALRLVSINTSNIGALPCCGIKSAEHAGRVQKNCWLCARFQDGLRANVFLSPDDRACGYIEYVPGAYAWRAVNAVGYMFIHCVWTFLRQYQRQGLGSRMLRQCLAEAHAAGMDGVAVVARDGPWMASSALFRRNGFHVADTAPPDYQLMVRKLKPSAADPKFKGDWERKLRKYGRGLTIIRSAQCPHIAKFAADIAETSEKEFAVKPRVVELRSCRQAQDAPTPYAVFAVIYNGQLLADHQISRTRFRTLMRTVARA